MLFFWLLVLAHGLADFILQTDAISAAKCKNKWTGYAYHGLAVFICTFAAVHFYCWKSALLAAGLVTVVHLSLDWLKNIGRALYAKILKKEARAGMPGLLMDQALHLLTLLWVWRLLDRPVDTAVAGFYAGVLAPLGQFSGAEKVVSGLAVYTLVAFGGAVLIRFALDQVFPPGYIDGKQRKKLGKAPSPVADQQGKELDKVPSPIADAQGKELDKVPIPVADEQGKELVTVSDSVVDGPGKEVAVGKYIGILERILILTLTVTGNISAIGIVFAAKSIARFNELSKKQFAEYYLVGTLLSFLLALAGGMALVRIWALISS